MKAHHVLSLLLCVAGSNLMTFGITRHWTTQHVLTRAQDRMVAALRDAGVYDQLYPQGRARTASLRLAIPLAGGMYFWWNDALIYWGSGAVFLASGLAASRYAPRKAKTG